jgi:3-phenylpropionate/trans-cinnamate dioxygenase ferredoxin reductase component
MTISFAQKQIDVVLGTTAIGIDRRSRRLLLDGDTHVCFDKLMIGTGSRARRLSVAGSHLDGVCYLRSIKDAIDLKSRLHDASEIVVVGGGFIGLEVAASAGKLGKKVTIIENGPRLLERAVSITVSQFLFDMHVSRGATVLLNETVTSIDGSNGRVCSVICGNGTSLAADLVLVGIGGIPNDQLARNAQLTCTNGIVVDEHGRTSEPNVFAAGDCANHFNVAAEAWLRLESVQNAQDQARAAGLAIAGSIGPYKSVPWFWSDQYQAKLQIVGISRNFDEQALRGSVSEGTFSIFYFSKKKLIAVDSVNRPGDQFAVRKLIAAGISPSLSEAADLSFDLKSVIRATPIA